MIITIVIAILVCIAMVSSIIFFPTIKLGKIKFSAYWVIALSGAVLEIIFSPVEIRVIGEALIANTAVNPIKILVLFLSMTALSVFLDELGFFEILASIALKKAGEKQFKLFLILYLLVSLLTVFTSNDVIVLSFTPFICYFAKNAKINPIPYLAAEFVAANTWSMALIIGNPTNIYLATAAQINFVEYLKYSVIPTILGGSVAFLALYLLFAKKLKEHIFCEVAEVKTTNKFLLWVGIVHLCIATSLLAISSYIGIEMWIASLVAVVSLFVFALVYAIVKRTKPNEFINCIKRIPYQLVPFVISMFIIIITLDGVGITKKIADLLGSTLPIIKYGTLSFVSANLINNIPMSVLFSSIINAGESVNTKGVFATIIGSNICAFFTPIGALAGIMWSSLIEKHGVKFTYLSFLKIGVLIAIPTLIFSLFGLYLSVLIF